MPLLYAAEGLRPRGGEWSHEISRGRGIGHPVGEGRWSHSTAAVISTWAEESSIVTLTRKPATTQLALPLARLLNWETKVLAPERSQVSKGWVGSASEALDNGITIGAVVVVNSTGSAFDRDGCILCKAFRDRWGVRRGENEFLSR